jgi:trk system potassium uptake protein TrkH
MMMFMNQIKWMLHPRGIFVNRYNGRLIGDNIGRSVVAFSFFYALTVAVLALALAAMGLDLVTSLSGAATAVGNVGPGLGDIIGPAGNFASLPPGAKWLLAFGMLLGRLEIFTVLIILTPAFWRN